MTGDDDTKCARARASGQLPGNINHRWRGRAIERGKHKREIERTREGNLGEVDGWGIEKDREGAREGRRRGREQRRERWMEDGERKKREGAKEGQSDGGRGKRGIDGACRCKSPPYAK